MGYWTQSNKGASFGEGGGIWGDGPADAFDAALHKIIEDFKRDFNRLPSLLEIRAGLEFSLGLYLDGAEDLKVPKLPELPPAEDMVADPLP